MQRSIASLVLALTSLGGCTGDDSSTPETEQNGAFTPGAITLREIPERNVFALVDERLVFVDAAGREWVAPRGTLTDGASVPRIVLPVTNGRFDATLLKAAVIHDAWCQEFNAEVCPDQYRKRPWPEVHRMFHEACLTGGTPGPLAAAMYSAVYWFGPRWGGDDESLEAVPEPEVEAEYEATQRWLEREEPSVEAIDRRLKERELDLRARHRITVPRSIQKLGPRQLDAEILRRRIPSRPVGTGR